MGNGKLEPVFPARLSAGGEGVSFHGEQGGEAAVSRQPLPSGPTGAWGTGTTDFQGQVTDLVQPKGVVLT